jgi:hypothetical protein
VDGAVVDFQLLPPDSRVRVHSQESFLSLVRGHCPSVTAKNYNYAN